MERRVAPSVPLSVAVLFQTRFFLWYSTENAPRLSVLSQQAKVVSQRGGNATLPCTIQRDQSMPPNRKMRIKWTKLTFDYLKEAGASTAVKGSRGELTLRLATVMLTASVSIPWLITCKRWVVNDIYSIILSMSIAWLIGCKQQTEMSEDYSNGYLEIEWKCGHFKKSSSRTPMNQSLTLRYSLPC